MQTQVFHPILAQNTAVYSRSPSVSKFTSRCGKQPFSSSQNFECCRPSWLWAEHFALVYARAALEVGKTIQSYLVHRCFTLKTLALQCVNTPGPWGNNACFITGGSQKKKKKVFLGGLLGWPGSQLVQSSIIGITFNLTALHSPWIFLCIIALGKGRLDTLLQLHNNLPILWISNLQSDRPPLQRHTHMCVKTPQAARCSYITSLMENVARRGSLQMKMIYQLQTKTRIFKEQFLVIVCYHRTTFLYLST